MPSHLMIPFCTIERNMEANPFLRALQLLHTSQVRYVIVGGFAVVMHGCNRFTPDLNVVVDFDDPNLGELMSQFESREIVPLPPKSTAQFLDPSFRQQESEAGKWFFSLKDVQAPTFSLDLFLKHPVPFEPLHESREILDLGGVQTVICGRDMLMEMKEAAGRGQDQLDREVLQIVSEIEEKRAAGDSDQEILSAASTDAERERLEGLLEFTRQSPEERMDWLLHMLTHLGKFCVI